jgi:hypothetical protein
VPSRRRRILLAVQPRVLRDALADVLDEVGLDDVLVSEREGADRSTMSFDAAIVSEADEQVTADVVIAVGESLDSLSHVITPTRQEDVHLRSPQQLLSLLDRFCPTTAARILPQGGAQQ